jgi:hypothetical protein
VNLKPAKKTVRLDSRSVILLRETGCERALAMVSASTNLDELEMAIARDDGFGDDLPLTSGAGALGFGQMFENTILRQKAQALRAPLAQLFTDDPIFRRLRENDKEITFTDFHSFTRGPEGTEANLGNQTVSRETSKMIHRRFRKHTEGSIILHGVLKIPHSARDWYLVPDMLVSPPGYTYYIPFEIKSYERMAHLTEDHHIASASVQSTLYLYALMHGSGPSDESAEPIPYPEVGIPRTDMRTGIIFRKNASPLPDPMLVAAARDLVAIEQILGEVAPDGPAFYERFGQTYHAVASGDLEAIEHIASTLSDACIHACRMAARCRDIARSQGLLSGYGDGLVRAYPEYGTIGAVRHALETADPSTDDPNLTRMLAVEGEIDRLLARVTA